MRSSIFDEIGELTISFKEKQRSGDIISRVTNDLGQVTSFLNNTLVNLFFQPIRLISAIVYLAIMDWRIMLICSVFLPITIAISSVLSKQMKNIQYQIQCYSGESNALLKEGIAGRQIIKSYNLQDEMSDHYKNGLRKVFYNQMKITKKYDFIYRPISFSIQMLPKLICILMGGYFAINGELTVGFVLSLIGLMNSVIKPIDSIFGLIMNTKTASAAVDRLLKLYHDQDKEAKGADFRMDNSAPAVEFKNVSFSYGGSENQLKNISFSCNAGEVTCLVGKSGSGKSSIIKSICGFYQPSAGEIGVYSNNLQSVGIQSVRRIMSYIPQSLALLDLSIYDNIFSSKDELPSQEKIDFILQAANIYDLINHLPKRLEETIGENGGLFSYGERQRIAFAMALYKNASILLLDEPTSALDEQSKHMVNQTIFQYARDHTVIISTHDRELIKKANKVIYIDNGEILGIGTHQSLLENNPYYRELINGH